MQGRGLAEIQGQEYNGRYKMMMEIDGDRRGSAEIAELNSD